MISDIRLSTAWWTAIILLFILWVLVLFLLGRWAYRRKGIPGLLLVIILGFLGALFLLLLSDDGAEKEKA